MVELNRRLLRDVDWITLLAPISLTLFGCVGIYSAAPQADHWKKQLIFLVIGAVCACIIAVTDYRIVIGSLAPFFYVATLVLLILVFTPLGATINQNRAWLRVAGFSLQPSEFAKLATIIMLARYLQQPRSGSLPLRDIIKMGVIVLAPVILILLEKDVGTMLTFGAIYATFCFLGGVRKLYIAAGVVAVIVGLVAVYPHLKPYQQKRIDVIIHPDEADPRGYGYQTVQTKITVGSGGFFGKGVTQGTQARLGFLPNGHSDFVASIIAEEMGFVGVLTMIGLYGVLLTRLTLIAKGARDRAGALMVMGLVSLLTFHIACNLGMVVGSLPIMGIPLPLMSAGGTSVVAVFMGIGLALSVRLRRFVN